MGCQVVKGNEDPGNEQCMTRFLPAISLSGDLLGFKDDNQIDSGVNDYDS